MKSLCLDPCKKFKEYNNQDLINACGFLYGWAFEALANDGKLLDYLGKCYIYPISGIGRYPEHTDKSLGIVREDGSMFYEGDPVFYPLFKAESEHDIFYVYEHAMVAFVDKQTKNYFVSRMD